MTVYYSVRISKRLLCGCNVYKYPHDVGRGLCFAELPDLDLVPVKVTPTTMKKVKDLIRDGYL